MNELFELPPGTVKMDIVTEMSARQKQRFALTHALVSVPSGWFGYVVTMARMGYHQGLARAATSATFMQKDQMKADVDKATDILAGIVASSKASR